MSDAPRIGNWRVSGRTSRRAFVGSKLSRSCVRTTVTPGDCSRGGSRRSSGESISTASSNEKGAGGEVRPPGGGQEKDQFFSLFIGTAIGWHRVIIAEELPF